MDAMSFISISRSRIHGLFSAAAGAVFALVTMSVIT